ncbi:MAG: sulfite exporter TauE/SafE family protein, partial [Actinomycetota bacterium]|nr:sulfite exporter TauE/SafE family protein [Actinomycetota bacterium]
ASGAMNVVAGIGGPAAALYALNAGWPPEATRATLQAYFLALNVVALASLGLPSLGLGQAVGLVVGWLAGTVLARRLPQQAAMGATLALAGGGGAIAVARGLGW